MKKTYFPFFVAILCVACAFVLKEEKLPRKGKDFALFIAINDYQYWNKLKHPINDVEKIARELRQHFDFDTLILRNPNLGQIIKVLQQHTTKSYPDDGQLLVFLSGHGDFNGSEGFFVPRDGKRDDEFQASYLSYGRLKSIIESIQCNHILVAIDACYSGTIDPSVAMRGREITFGRPDSPNGERNRYIEKELTLRSRYILASSGKEQTPDASNFAAYFLRALQNRVDEYGLVSIKTLQDELSKANPKPRTSSFGDHHEDSNFLFIKSEFVLSNTKPKPRPQDDNIPDTIEEPQTTRNPCAVNQTGDVCVENGRTKKIWVNVNKMVVPLAPGAKECFYEIKAGILTIRVTTYAPGGGSYTLGGASDHQVKIEACSTATKVIR